MHIWKDLPVSELRNRGKFWEFHYNRTNNPLLKEKIIKMFDSFMYSRWK